MTGMFRHTGFVRALGPLLVGLTLALFAGAGVAWGQASGGFEGRVVHHVLTLESHDGRAEPLAEVWIDRETGAVALRAGPIDPAALDRPLRIETSVTDSAAPADARRVRVQAERGRRAGWATRAHLLAGPDGITSTVLRLRLAPGCVSACPVVGVDRYRLPGGRDLAPGVHVFDAVDAFPIEPEDALVRLSVDG